MAEAPEAADGLPAQLPYQNHNIPFPPKLDLKANLAYNWKRFNRVWENYEIATGLVNQANKLRTATFLTCVGPDAIQLYEGFQFGEEEDRNDLSTVQKKFAEFCIGKQNETYERYCFNKRDQEQSETVDSYVSTLRSLAKTCNYGTLEESLIRDRIVIGIRDNTTRKKLLVHSNLSLSACIDICRANEKSAMQIKEINNEEVQFVGNKNRLRGGNKQPQFNNNSTLKKECMFCGHVHAHKKESCPAFGKTCNKCKQQNHFEAKCESLKAKQRLRGRPRHNGNRRRNKIHCLESETDSEDDNLFTITQQEEINMVVNKKLHAVMLIKGQKVKLQLDCGATVNVLPIDVYKRVNRDKNLTKLTKTPKALVMYNGTQIKPAGKCVMKLTNPKNKQTYTTEFMIVNGNVQPILGSEIIQEMELITVNMDRI